MKRLAPGWRSCLLVLVHGSALLCATACSPNDTVKPDVPAPLPDTPVISDGLHAPVASDGTKILVKTFAAPTSRAAAPGTGKPLPQGESTCQASEKEPQIGVRGGIIGGNDDLTPVPDPSDFPHRALVVVSSPLAVCTGWMYGDRIVATAGHCLHSGGKNGIWAPDVTVTPARNGGTRPFGSEKARRLYSVKGWTEEQQEGSDYGAVLLGCDMGAQTGTFGYGWTSTPRTGTAVVHAGYPGRVSYQQQQSPGVIYQEIANQVFYDADSWMGMSGGPVFSTAPCVNCVVGIHTDLKHPEGEGQPPFTELNHGVAITRTVFQNLEAWKNLP